MTVGNNSESFRFLFGTQFENSWIVSHKCQEIDAGAYCPLNTFNYTASDGEYLEQRINGVTYRSINESLGYYKESDDQEPQVIFDRNFNFSLIEDLSNRR